MIALVSSGPEFVFGFVECFFFVAGLVGGDNVFGVSKNDGD